MVVGFDVMSALNDLYDSVVVDREVDVRLVTNNFYELFFKRKQLRVETESLNYRLTLCFAPHFFGSGKTTFCRNYLSLVQKLNEEALEDSHDDLSKSFLENLKEAAFLYLDLQKLEQVPPKDRNFKWALYYLMMRAASDSVGEEAEDPDAAFKACYTSSSRLARKLRSILNIPSSQYLVVAFDEIGALEDVADDFDFRRHPVVGIRPYNDFFGVIRELCELDNLFFLVVGKSNGLSIENYATSVSRVLLEFIPLSPLDSSSIKEHLEKSPTTLPNRPLVSEFLCGASLRVEELADALLEYTGGVPGLLTRAVNLLLNDVKSRKEPLSKDKCVELMENEDFQEFCTQSFYSGWSIKDDNTRHLLDILLIMALYHTLFASYSHLPSRASVFDVATEMGFYRRQIDWNTLKKDFLKLRTEPADYFYDSKCRLFEGLVAMQLHRILSSKVENGPFRQLLSQLSPIWRQMKCTMDSESSICYMKSIHHSEIVSLSKRSRNSFESNEWKQIILETLEYEKIYITTNTFVPDILFKLHSLDLASTLVVGIVCKGCWKSKGLNWSDLINEAEKFLVPIHDQVLSESLKTFHCMLIIVGTKLSSTVATELNYESRCYSSGSLIGDTFTVPPNCELVILSQNDLAMFIGREILNGLGEAFRTTDNLFAMTDKPNWNRVGVDLCNKFVVG
eukprot:jgi/Galph1/4369/GphlegSOOS_G2953.1